MREAGGVEEKRAGVRLGAAFEYELVRRAVR
jgi:hypothetical protein